MSSRLSSKTSGFMCSGIVLAIYFSGQLSLSTSVAVMGMVILLQIVLAYVMRVKISNVLVEETEGKKFKVAIAGSGLAGLGLANVLDEAGFDVTVFEAGEGAGLASKGKLELPNGKFVDVPLRMISPAAYPTLFPMLQHLECPYKEIPTDWNLLSPTGEMVFKSNMLDFGIISRVRRYLFEWTKNGRLFEFIRCFSLLLFCSPRQDETIAEFLVRTGVEKDEPGSTQILPPNSLPKPRNPGKRAMGLSASIFV